MLRSVKSLVGYKIEATDGVRGKVDNFLFRDSSWIIRYVVVDTGGRHPGGRVLISPVSVGQPVAEARLPRVSLTKDQVKNSPGYDPSAPVNQEYETRLYDFYGRPKYWAWSTNAAGFGAVSCVSNDYFGLIF